MENHSNNTDALAAVTQQLQHTTREYLEPLLTKLKQQVDGTAVSPIELAKSAYYTARRIDEISYRAAYNQYRNALSKIEARGFTGPDESLVQDALHIFQDALSDLQAMQKEHMRRAEEHIGCNVSREIADVKVDHPQYEDAFLVLAKQQQEWAADPAHMKVSLDFIEHSLTEIVRVCTAHHVLTTRLVPEAHYEHRDFHQKEEIFIEDGMVLGYLHGLFSAVERGDVCCFLGQDVLDVIRSVF